MPSNRDDFSEAVKRALRERVGSRCSRPDCRVPTTGPSDDAPDKAVRVGDAAHITGASREGPRFDPSITRAQRKSARNGIWLCCIHAREVDHNKSRYTTEELRRWKEEAERMADNEKGRPLPSMADVQNQMVALFNRAPAYFAKEAIRNTHAAMGRSLNELDPKAVVHTGFEDGHTTYRIEPAPGQNLVIHIEAEGPAAHALGQAMSRVEQDGDEVELSLDDGITIRGSPVFEALIETGGTLSMSAVPRDAALRMAFPAAGPLDEEGFAVEFLGQVRFGTASASFTGKALGGIFEATLRHPLKPDGEPPSAALHFSIAPWESLDVQQLPHRQRAAEFARRVAAGVVPRVEFDFGGPECVRTTITRMPDVNSFSPVLRTLQYIEDAVVIARYLRASIAVAGDLIASDGVRAVHDLATAIRAISEPQPQTADDGVSVKLVPTDALKADVTAGGLRHFRIDWPERDLDVFGKPITVPALTLILSNMLLTLAPDAAGDVATLEATPQEGSKLVCWPAAPTV